ncbi:hypothetical protein PG991_015864 [Apiospora marii]|uniref:Uncharacterized protein n=1 Tax=Apiospora marii TaxID=335849 RepID=A0ABR1R049_9PEZI
MAPLTNPLPALTPTRTLPSLLTRVLAPRQATTTIIDGVVVSDAPVDDNHDNHLSGGAIAGIVIGSIVGFLLLVWLIRCCMNLGKPGQRPPPRKRSHNYRYHQETMRSRSGGPYHHHHHHHSRSRSHGHSPRRSVEVRQVSTVRPASGYYETRRGASRGRSPAAPPMAYYPPQEARNVRRESRRASRGYY